ncbi:hypothetical protein ETH_00040605, partial [Eimeria tenella]
VGQQLLELEVLREVPESGVYLFECTYTRKFVLQQQQQTAVSNFLFKWTKPAAEPLPLVEYLLRQTLDLLGSHSAAGGLVESRGVCTDPRCLQVFLNCCELQTTILFSLQQQQQQHLAFFLNLFNLAHTLALLQ